MEVDLFTLSETAQCPLLFSLSPPVPLGIDALTHVWILYGFCSQPNQRIVASEARLSTQSCFYVVLLSDYYFSVILSSSL